MTDSVCTVIYTAVMDIDDGMYEAVRFGVYDAVREATYIPVTRATAAPLDARVRPAVVDGLYAGAAAARNLTNQQQGDPP